jgi:hypothetical protein
MLPFQAAWYVRKLESSGKIIYRTCLGSCLTTVCDWKRSPLIEFVNTFHIIYFKKPCCITCCTVGQVMDMTSFKIRVFLASVNYQNLFWSVCSELPFCEMIFSWSSSCMWVIYRTAFIISIIRDCLNNISQQGTHFTIERYLQNIA